MAKKKSFCHIEGVIMLEDQIQMVGGLLLSPEPCNELNCYFS